MNNDAICHQLKTHLEEHASLELARKLLHLLPPLDELDLRPHIGNRTNKGNLEAIQTWVKAIVNDHPTCCFELTLEHWHTRLVFDLLHKLNDDEGVE
jgi:hypothetical protein